MMNLKKPITSLLLATLLSLSGMSMDENRNPFELLPPQIFKYILNFTDLQTVGRSMQVSKKWNKITKNEYYGDSFKKHLKEENIIYRVDKLYPGRRNDLTALRWAAGKDCDLLKWLLKVKNFNQQELLEALDTSILQRKFNSFELLLEYKAPLTFIADPYTPSPLTNLLYLMGFNNISNIHKFQFMKKLLEEKADPNFIDTHPQCWVSSSSSYLQYLVVRDSNASFVLLLLEQPTINIDVLDEFGETPLERALFCGNLNAALLLHHGADFNKLSDFNKNRVTSRFYNIPFYQYMYLLISKDSMDLKENDQRRKTCLKLLLIKDKIKNLTQEEGKIIEFYKKQFYNEIVSSVYQGVDHCQQKMNDVKSRIRTLNSPPYLSGEDSILPHYLNNCLEQYEKEFYFKSELIYRLNNNLKFFLEFHINEFKLKRKNLGFRHPDLDQQKDALDALIDEFKERLEQN